MVTETINALPQVWGLQSGLTLTVAARRLLYMRASSPKAPCSSYLKSRRSSSPEPFTASKTPL